jgi:predicted ArsR family transcriptional regulator
MREFERNVAGISALADPVRQRLYEFVCSQGEPVSRDQAAAAVGIARHQAKFHLDRLEAEGLLETDYVRLTGRTGPGAGRPAKRYRRGRTELSVTVPAREYDLAADIMAAAITTCATKRIPIEEAVQRAAADYGVAMAGGPGHVSSTAAALSRLIAALDEHGYEPRQAGRTISLANCPFHALAQRHTQLVCQMNHALLAGLAGAIAPGCFEVRLEPGEERCCVTVTEEAVDQGER